MLLSGRLLTRFFVRDPSGRAISREIQRQSIPSGSLAVAGMNRGMQYSLSFYLHEEIKTWDANSATGGYLLTNAKNCESLVRPRFSCEQISFDENDLTGKFLYRLLPANSAVGFSDRGKAH
jgi:hypothetical protein